MLGRQKSQKSLSTEQTRNGVREKETKTGRGRTVALTALAVEELRRDRAS